MLETTRQAYLHAMGIDTWLPTRTLPGAAPSSQWEWQEPAAPAKPASASSPPTRADADQARREARAALRADLPGAPPAPTTKPLSVTPAAEPAADTKPQARPAAGRASAPSIPRFVLQELLFADCLVLAELPQASKSGLGEQHRRLLMAILRALGLGQAGMLREERFRWPLLESPFMDMGEEVARAALADRVALHAKQTPVSLILVFADQIQGLVLNRTDQPDALRGQLLEGPGNIQTLATLSLHQALALPETKAEIWRDLQPLRRRRL